MKNILKLMLGLAVCLPLLALAQATNLFTDATGSNVTGNPLADAGALIAALLIVGAILKNAVPQFPTRFIPLLTMVGGTIGYMLMTDSAWGSGKAWFTALLVAASATGIHSGIKNTVQGVGEKLVTLAFTASFFSLCLAGCASTPKQVVTVTGIVDSAMKTWAREYVAGRTTPEIDEKVQTAHAAYRKAAATALASYQAFLAGGNESGALNTLKALRAAAYPLLDALIDVSPKQASDLTEKLKSATQP